MIPLPFNLSTTQTGKNKAVFEAQGLYPGYGVTVGNALRRVLLSSLEGVAVTEVKIQGVPHEFSTIKGVHEDVIMMILNLKNLRFSIREGQSHTLELKVKGERTVTGADFEIPPQVSLANPELPIATITDKGAELSMEITIEKGLGYEPKDQRRAGKPEIGAIAMDAIFTPIKNVNFRVENMRVGERTDFDRLFLEIETDGTLTPENAFSQACDILIRHFSFLFDANQSAREAAEKPATSGKAAKVDASGGDPDKIGVEDLKLSVRTVSALTENHIKTVAGLLKKSEQELSELEGMGEKAVAEVKKAVKKRGFSLREESE